MSGPVIELGLHAAVVAVDGRDPLVLTVNSANDRDQRSALPFGPFDPNRHRTLEAGLRSWVAEQTQLPLGYVEQLYTFGDRGRFETGDAQNAHLVSVGYLALVRRTQSTPNRELYWSNWYDHFPWEDWRGGEPSMLTTMILPALQDWVSGAPTRAETAARDSRMRLAFGCDFGALETPVIHGWDEERVLDRYELMYEAGLVDEAQIDGVVAQLRVETGPGRAMLNDHRRILATAMARLRAKLKYRPVVFELMEPQFTLTELQQTVETLSGRNLHKQNFRRLVEKTDLVEPTGRTTSQTGGRPAAYFQFKSSITRERPAPGLRVGSRS